MIPVAALVPLGKFLVNRWTIVVVAIVGLFVMWKRTEAEAFRRGQAEAAAAQLQKQYDSTVARNTRVIVGLDSALRRVNARFDTVDRRLTWTLARNATLGDSLEQLLARGEAPPADMVGRFTKETATLRADCKACQESARAMRDTASSAIQERDRATASERAMRDTLAKARTESSSTPTSIGEKSRWAAVGAGVVIVARELLKLLRR